MEDFSEMWSKAPSLEVILHLDGNNWMQRNLSVFPHLVFILSYCNLKSFLEEAGVIYIVGWLTQTPSTPLQLEMLEKRKKTPTFTQFACS